jgi:agmatine/peptidylarginine deiminase
MSNCLPPEWHNQDAVMLTWPHGETDWAKNLASVEPVFVQISLAILTRQQLLIICHSLSLKKHISQLLLKAGARLKHISFIIAKNNDSWARDHGPLSVINRQGQIIALNFTFNGWGKKYSAVLDNEINLALFNQLGINNHITIDMVLEGGGIEVDQCGHLLTTENCLLNQNRNPQMTQADIEAYFFKQFGVKKVLWLQHGKLEGDDTDCHIDTLARFAPEQTIIYQGCLDQSDSHYDEMLQMKCQLKAMRTLKNQPFRLLELPWPESQFNSDGQRLPATYANFLIINGAVLVPSYGVGQDRLAAKVVQQAFPKHEILLINCRPIIEQCGSLHCLTMQFPQGFLPRENVHVDSP